MAAKTKKHLTGPEMSALVGPLSVAQTALAQASFFIAARVANAAWSLLQELNTHGISAASPQPVIETLTKLQAALSDYSPGNWPPPVTYRSYAAQRLEELYAEIETLQTKEEFLEKIYEYASKEHEG